MRLWSPPSWWRFPWAPVMLIVIVAALGIGFAAVAKADPSKVMVWEDVPNHDRIAERIKSQMNDKDEIAVYYSGGWSDPATMDEYMANNEMESIFIFTDKKGIWVRGNDWMPSTVANDMLDRVKSVNRSAIDRIVGMIYEIHKWQEANPRPPNTAPQPAPPVVITPDIPADPGVGTAAGQDGPSGPSFWDFHWWNWKWGWAPILFVVLVAVWWPLEKRRRRRYAEYAKRADEQADWGVSEYNIKTSIE